MKTKAVQVWTTDGRRELLKYDPSPHTLDSQRYQVVICHCDADDLRQLALAIRSALEEAELTQAPEQEEKADVDQTSR